MQKSKSLKKKIIIGSSVTAASLLLLFLIIPYSVAAIVCDYIFGKHFYTTEYLRYEVADFEGLKADGYEFQSNNHQTLKGYRYYLPNSTPQGVVVLAHGFGGGGQNGYMDVANYFVQNGYDVFAYDATGNDESEGKTVKGLPQGVIDLHYALEYIKGIDALKNLPVMLWGHSWGGYCVSSILAWHPEVKAVAAIAGFDRSGDLMESHGVQKVGEVGKIFMPYVNSIERIRFGDYAAATAINGFTHSDAGIFIAHSADDDVVPIEYGYEKYYKTFANNARFKFVRSENSGHSDILYSKERIEYMEKLYQQTDAHFNGKNVTDEERAVYIRENLDRSIFCNGLNTSLFSQIIAFYSAYLYV